MNSFLYGEFDHGSGLTLAACIIHASRTVVAILQWQTGEERVGTCLALRDSSSKDELIPDGPARVKLLRCERGLRSIS